MNTIRSLSLLGMVSSAAYMLVYPLGVAVVCAPVQEMGPGCALWPHPLVNMFALGIAMGCAIITVVSHEKTYDCQ